MSDIFISYKREDRERAKRIALALEKRGFSVWWDRKIPPGRTFDEVIQEALDAARCVIVLWSEESVRSNWVKEEAEKGASRGVLVPILIDDVPIPLGFGRLQTASLVDWDGSAEHHEFVRLKRSIRAMLGRPEETAFLPQMRGSGIGPIEHAAAPPPRARKPARTKARASASTAARRGRSAARMAVLAAMVLLAAGAVAAFLFRDRMLPGSEQAVAFAAPAQSGIATELGVLETLVPGPGAPPLGDQTPQARDEDGEAEAPAIPPSEPTALADAAGAEAAELAENGTIGEPDAATDDATVDEGGAAVDGSDDPGDLDAGPGDGDCVVALSELRGSELDGALERAELQSAYESLWQRCSRALAASDGAWVVRAIDRLGEPEPEAEAEARAEPAAISSAAAAAAAPDTDATGWARIAAADDFVTCRDVRRGAGVSSAPVGVGDSFAPGTVWVFARVRAPRRQEVVTVRWLGVDRRVVREHRVTVGRNLGAGYRIFAAKSYAEPGRYAVELYNQNGEQIAHRPFTIL